MLRAMTLPSGGLFQRETLELDLCRTRLAGAAIARVVISVRCLPAALPVFLHLAEHHVLIAATEEAVIEAARNGDVLAVQIDGTEPDGSTWSVQATGVAHVPDESDALATLSKESPLVGVIQSGATLVAISLTVLRGDRIRWAFPG